MYLSSHSVKGKKDTECVRKADIRLHQSVILTFNKNEALVYFQVIPTPYPLRSLIPSSLPTSSLQEYSLCTRYCECNSELDMISTFTNLSIVGAIAMIKAVLWWRKFLGGWENIPRILSLGANRRSQKISTGKGCLNPGYEDGVELSKERGQSVVGWGKRI